MKTVEEFYQEFAASKELQEELKAASEDRIQAFLKKHGCDADVKAFLSLVKGHSPFEISDADADAVAGGAPPSWLQEIPTPTDRILPPI